jgi:hypothetical protein
LRHKFSFAFSLACYILTRECRIIVHIFSIPVETASRKAASIDRPVFPRLLALSFLLISFKVSLVDRLVRIDHLANSSHLIFSEVAHVLSAVLPLFLAFSVHLTCQEFTHIGSPIGPGFLPSAGRLSLLELTSIFSSVQPVLFPFEWESHATFELPDYFGAIGKSIHTWSVEFTI